MTAIKNYLARDHRHCDESIAKVETAVAKSRWDEVLKFSDIFIKEMYRHFYCEESILFPAFEKITQMGAGPTTVMRMEHAQMKEMLGQFQEAIEEKNIDRVLGLTDTIMIFIQQHNAKEEQMLYPMCDMHLIGQAIDLITQMDNIKIS